MAAPFSVCRNYPLPCKSIHPPRHKDPTLIIGIPINFDSSIQSLNKVKAISSTKMFKINSLAFLVAFLAFFCRSVEAYSDYELFIAIYVSIGGFLFITFASIFIYAYVINGKQKLCACLRSPGASIPTEDTQQVLPQRKSIFFGYTIFGGENTKEKSQVNILNSSTGKSATNSEFQQVMNDEESG